MSTAVPVPIAGTNNRSEVPRSRGASSQTVAVFGAGIAGLTVAHELVRLGYRVTVYEANPEAGGFFRSARLAQNQFTPSEYSWHGFGPWYHNAFDLMKQIPFDGSGSVYDRGLSRPVDFGIFPDEGQAAFYDRGLASIPRLFRMSRWDAVRWTWLMLKTWTANRRSEVAYATQNAADAFAPLLSARCQRTWRSSFGPWIGSDWTKVSLHQTGQFFRKQLFSRPAHFGNELRRHGARADLPDSCGPLHQGAVHRGSAGPDSKLPIARPPYPGGQRRPEFG